ncbi:MAG: DUF1592 domain-containing protein [Verrucomicrobiae bacterium]|nr:DUF1592 domain-containing protein [Verrucomicrobiae bacterium]
MNPFPPARLFCRRILPCWVAGLTLLGGGNLWSADDDDRFSAEIRPLLEEYCIRCHGGDETKGDVDLTGLNSEAELVAHRELWESVIEQVDTEEMPNKGPHPSGEERAALTRWIRDRFAAVDWSRYRSPGRVTLPRLSKAEYRNTMRDLIGVDLNAGADLPEDGEGESGFTNDRDSLSMTSAQLEQYFESAERAIDGAFALAKPERDWQFEAESMQRSPAKLKPHENGIVIVHPDHELQTEINFPVDGWYQFQIGAAAIGEKACVADFRVDGESIASARVETGDLSKSPIHEATGFVRAGRHTVTIQSRNLVPQTPEPPDIVRIIDERAHERAPRLAPFSDSESVEVREAREGLNTKALGAQESVEWLRFLGPKGDSRKIDLRRVYLEERRADWREVLERLARASGISAKEIEAKWETQNAERLADNRQVLASVSEVKWEDWMQFQGKLFVDRFEVRGPIFEKQNSSGGWNLVEALRDPGANPETLIRELLPQAFRRSMSEAEGDRYVELLRVAQRREELREDALTIALSAILTSPRFLYRDELGKASSTDTEARPPEALDDWALASRLSYFLWQTMPDAELFDMAASGLLRNPAELARQGDRMLDDPKADAFFANFASDWLGLRELGRGVAPDPSRFPEFSSELIDAMKAEAFLFLASVFREDQPVSALIDSPVVFLNERLAAHYGIPGVVGESFRPVHLNEARRGGVLGLGSVLVATSSPARTNPVRRGAWVLERILGDDPGEALPTAGVLPGNAGEARGLTLREELERHRNQAECARCHDRIDPIGFGLQNFDATGRWRDLEAGKPVDARGVLPGGSEFVGPAELKRVLREEHREAIIENLARRLLAFALGRELHGFDQPAIEEIVAAVEAADGSSRELVRQVIRSEAFRFQDRSTP